MKKIIRFFTVLILTTIVFLGSVNSTKPLKAEERFMFPEIEVEFVTSYGEHVYLKDSSITLKIEEVDSNNNVVPGGFTQTATNN